MAEQDRSDEDPFAPERLAAWAERVLDDEARAEEHLTDDELHYRWVIGTAASYVLADAWLITHPDDPEMRRYLVEDEAIPAEHVDAVLAKMREIGASRGL